MTTRKRHYYVGIMACVMLCSAHVGVFAVEDVTEKTQEELEAEQRLEQERKEQEDAYEDRKEKIENDIERKQKDKNILEVKYNSVQQSLGTTQRTIADVEADLAETNQEIDRHVAQILSLDDQIALYRSSLAYTLREAYFAHNDGGVIAVASNDTSQRFLAHSDDLAGMQARIAQYVRTVDAARAAQEQKKKDVEQLRDTKKTLLKEHEQKAAALASQAVGVQREIVKVDASLQELQAKLSAVESKLSALLGKSYSTDDIVEAAKFASKKTGVRKDFILGMLVVETNLGRFTGGCTYKESRMSLARQEAFKGICKKLGYDYKKQKVSCPPKNYKGTGGAMGVAQFMPDTWKAYESKIASHTGHNPPDPWSLTDGVMAMALKLANDGATKKSGEWQAASRYLGTCSTKSTRFYCEDVLYWADNYEKKL